MSKSVRDYLLMCASYDISEVIRIPKSEAIQPFMHSIQKKIRTIQRNQKKRPASVHIGPAVLVIKRTADKACVR